MKKFLLIDVYNFLFRAYHALPKTLKDEEGNPTNAVYGVTSMLINIFDTLKPDYIAAALDGAKPTFRVEEFTGYKAHRVAMESDLAVQIPKVFEVLDAFGIPSILVDGYEADDVIGTLAYKYGKSDGLDIIIASNDRDLWQLVDSHVHIMIPGGNGKESEWLGVKEVEARMGFAPLLIPDYKGLRGDPSDNIPGVFGVGEKTAKSLVVAYGNVENIYKNIDQIKPETLRKKLAECAEQAVLSKKLASIITNVPFKINLDECKYSSFNKAGVAEVLRKYNFKSLIKRLGFEVDSKKEEVSEDQLSLF